eukprot:8612033-Pyramimonas_sp.AAC.1
MKAWLATHIPSWRNMTVADRAEYLGALLGPAVTLNDIWKAAGGKWLFRVLELAGADCPVHLTTHMYNARVLPTLGYLAQLFPRPKAIRCREGWAMMRIWHLPPQSLAKAD